MQFQTRRSRKSSVGAIKTVEKKKLVKSNFSKSLVVAEEMKVWETRFFDKIKALKEQVEK